MQPNNTTLVNGLTMGKIVGIVIEGQELYLKLYFATIFYLLRAAIRRHDVIELQRQ